MDVDVPTFTPRLRMSRYSPVQYDKSSNLASTSEAGPSRLPNFSQILDLDIKDIPFSDDQFSFNELNTPKASTTPTATRSDNPAAVLRALLSRLPAHPPSPTQSHVLSVQGGTERESDFDTPSVSNVAPSIAQESLKHIFSKAVRDPGNTPQKAKRRRNSIDASAVEASPRVEKERATNKGKRRSMSDDEVENTSQSVDRRDIRSKSKSQPVTLEFLRERFIDSHNLGTSVGSPKIPSNQDSSNDAASIFQDLNSSQATPPAATSTPRQSLRLSASSRFQLHSNLLDQDSEMQKAIEGLDSYDEGLTHDQTSTNGALDSSKTLQTSPALPYQSSNSTLRPKPTLSSSQKLTRDQSHSMDDLRTPSQHRERFHVHPSRSPSPALQLHSRHNVTSDNSYTKPSKDRSAILHSERHRRSEIHSNSRLSPLLRTEIYSHDSPSATAESLRIQNRDDDYVDVVHERERNWDSPRPIWHKRPRDMESDGLRDTDFSSQGETPKPKVVASSPDVSENDHSGSPTPVDKDDLHEQNGFGRSPPHHTAQTDTNTFPSTPIRSKASRSLINEFKTPSPPKGLPDLPTPSSSDESDRDSPRSKQLHRNIQSSLKWMTTPKPPGGWLNTPKPSRESSPSDIVAQSDGDTPADIQSFFQTPKPPGGWVSNPALQPIPVDSPVDIPEQNRGLLTPIASLSKGSKLELKTPAVPGAWLATPAVKKSILKVRFEPDGADDLQRIEQLSSKSPPSPHRQRSSKPKIRVLDAFGREQELGVSKQEHINSSSIPRVVDALGHEIDEGSHVEGTETAATSSHPTFSRGELLSRIRNGLDDLVVDIDEFDKDNPPLSIDHDKLQQLTAISSQARELRGRLYSQADSSRSLVSNALDTKKSWFPTNPKVYIFLIVLQLSLIWLTYRISINRAQEFWLNRYYDPFNPELHLYTSKFGMSPFLRSEGARTTAWSSLVGKFWDMWIYFIGSVQFCFWQTWDKGAVLQYDNAWTPT